MRNRFLFPFLFFVIALRLVVGCDGDGLGQSAGTPAQTSGESHFGVTRSYLRVCEDGVCEQGDLCACAVCTVPCIEASDCAERILGRGADPNTLPDNVVCLEPLCGVVSEMNDAPGAAESVCEVTCEVDDDCAFLDQSHEGRPHVCRAGTCRTDEDPEIPSDPAPSVSPCAEGRSLLPGTITPDEIGLCLDTEEVTVEEFRACVDAGDCTAPTAGNYLTAARDAHPINFVDEEMAAAYCASLRGRLPTFAEWQSAIGEEAYPWGENAPMASDAPALLCAFDVTSTCEVGAASDGRGPYGHADLIGNVSEIVIDADAPCVAGGAFDSPVDDLSAQSCAVLTAPAEATGFRCVNDL